MDNDEALRILGVMRLLARCEGSVSRYYRACAVALGDGDGLWSSLAGEEAGHRTLVLLMMERVRKAPSRFRLGDASLEEMLLAFICGVERQRALVEAGAADRRGALVMARDVERCLLEAGMLDFVESTDPMYLDHRRTILAETAEHAARLAGELGAREDPL